MRRYFIADKATHQEPKNPYYRLLEEEVVNRILSEFGLEGAEAHIINGHIPVEAKRGESPVKCGGKLLIIDGGFSKAYQPKTGIAGYTLIYNSYGLVLAAHEPFESVEKAVQDGSDIASHTILVQHVVRRKLVADTDIGRELRASIRDLEGAAAGIPGRHPGGEDLNRKIEGSRKRICISEIISRRQRAMRRWGGWQ